jgi:hypothetical protein
MLTAANESGRISILNCGFVRERGIERTSTQRLTPDSPSNDMKASIERVECPIVKTAFAGTDGVSPDIYGPWRPTEG